MVRAVDKADAMLTLSSALYRKPFTIYLPFTDRRTGRQTDRQTDDMRSQDRALH